MKKSKKLSPLEELRMEKDRLKTECAEKEEQMLSYISYLGDNIGSIIVNTVIRSFGVKGKSTSVRSEEEDAENVQGTNLGASTVMQTVWNGLQITYPYIKEIAQPLIIGFVANKVRNIFRKKKNRS